MLLLLSTLFPLLLPPPIAALSPPAADAAALLSFKSAADPAGNRLPFLPSTPPCTWPGITCSTNQRVTRLLLQNLSLNGTFPNSTLTRLNQLRLLSLKSNSISGQIPDLTPLFNLKALFLSHNLLSGPFPVSVVALHRLRTLDLSHNFLTGSIPSGLALLDRLYSFRLDSNRVSGAVPFMNQSSLKVFNVSVNDLSGAVPVTVVLSSFGAGAFDGNVRLCGAVVRRECGSRLDFFKRSDLAPGPGRFVEQGLIFGERRRKKKGVLEGGLFACGVILATVLIGVCLVVREKRKRGMMGKNVVSDVGVGCEMDGSGEREGAEEVEERCKELVAAAAEREEKMKRMGRSGSLVFCGGEVEVYSMEELMRASAEMLGRGSVGSTYKAVLDNRMVVCVKRLDGGRISESGKEGFERHMEVVGRLRHGNLVPLRAFFQAKEERLLVYDYQPNGSLYSLIHGSRSTKAKPLHWTSCLKIAEDVAQGLAYIHQASRLVHGNIRSTNVLLGSDFEARLADNCLASLVEPPVGTDDDSGYRAPETARKPDWQPTPKSDIFSFGALLLELLTGKPPQFLATAADLPNWVRSARDDEGADEERLRMIVGVAAACVRSSPESRPTAWQVLKMIQEVKEADVGDDDGSDSCVS